MRKLGLLKSCVFFAVIAASCAGGTANPPAPETRSGPGQSTPAATTAPRPGAISVTITRSAYGSISAQTAPGATCSASARLPSGRESTAQGLDTHNADASGTVSLTYRTVANTGAGTGTHTVTCSSGGQSKTASAPFTVQ